MRKKAKKRWNILKKWTVIFTLTVAITYSVYFFLFSTTVCNDFSCFFSNLKECKKTTFIGGTDILYKYDIIGKTKKECIINVKLIQGDFDKETSKALEGKEMKCYLPLGVVAKPEADIDLCHGILKENLQDQIIQKLHVYLVQNIKKINLEVLDIPPELIKKYKKLN